MINLSANEKYEERMSRIKGRLKDIEGLLENHDIKSGAHKHYGHVGDLSHVAAGLAELERFLGNYEETTDASEDDYPFDISGPPYSGPSNK